MTESPAEAQRRFAREHAAAAARLAEDDGT